MSTENNSLFPDLESVPWGFGSSCSAKVEHNAQFYWYGVEITTITKFADVKGTDFGQEFNLLFSILNCGDGIPRNPFDKERSLRRHVITHIYPLLQEIAPEKGGWKTVHDYLNTRSYTIQLFAEPDSGEVVPRITENSVKSAHWLQPTSMQTFDIPQDVPLYRAAQLVVDEQLKGIFGSANVKTLDGQFVQFVPCRKGNMGLDGVYGNRSFSEISFHLHVHELQVDRFAKVPRLVGIADVDGTGTSMAGVLIENIKGTALMESEELIKATDRHQSWRQDLESTATILHKHGITQLGIHPNYVIVDESDNAWLSNFTVHQTPENTELETAAGKDLQDIRDIFDIWLPGEQIVEIEETDMEKQRRRARFMRHFNVCRFHKEHRERDPEEVRKQNRAAAARYRQSKRQEKG